MMTDDLGPAVELTMDTFVRKLMRALFDADNSQAELQVTLENTGEETDPVLEFNVALTAINGISCTGDKK